MDKLNPDKLNVDYMPGVTATEPVIGRKYTLTHSDITAELFLSIGLSFAYDKINEMRDEVLGEWRMFNGELFLYIYVYVDSQLGPMVTAVRNSIFRRELPLALEAIRYGDSSFFQAHMKLDFSPIWIHFDSANSNYNRYENWGTPKDYK